MRRHVRPNAEPGTGTQTTLEASPPCACRGELSRDECGDRNHEHPNTFQSDGRRWKVGWEYWDSELRDLVELTAVIRKSSWCDTRDPENAPVYLVFDGGRVGTTTVQPERQDYDITERFTPRRESDRPLGAPNPPW